MANGKLKRYYESIFPTNTIFDWLSYGKADAFSKREFSFTIDDFESLRYQSFENAEQFKDELIKKIPNKIDIGAVYKFKPKIYQSGGWNMIPVWKEFVIKIDITYYNDIRFCCGSLNICKKCWTLMKVAVKILERLLCEDWGYDHILWVYSGQRGIHGWVCDKGARNLTQRLRQAVVGYATVVKDKKENKRVQLDEDSQWPENYHPKIIKDIAMAKQYFVTYALTDQCLLDNPESVKRVLQMIPNEKREIRDNLFQLWTNEVAEGQSENRWQIMSEYFEKDNNSKLVNEIILECVYPRLDANVSIKLEQFLQSPFCANTDTGRICVPFRLDKVDEFDPFTVPTLDGVVAEMEKLGDVMLTSLGPYLQVFKDFVKALPKD